ncbi:BolA/IbaG family iron-sulfur metabolism protein [Thalassotalea nanhaiensis]|uniref:BolA/IbaG family iron-sulfur metabolism protein n=1 Tax=Thalassotalea nanhaiensis TaxID=3065648 RepID=A0ABY9TH55_9GAMM|nr:BolA/IbaG family iron-sulfur metabolism protein [Colwelliaceae bacterium SQ345]
MTIAAIIEQKLLAEFTPIYLEVNNESFMHNVPEGSESHFKVVIVSEKFEGQRLIGRHRQVNATLADELENHIHALAMHTYTPEQWQTMNNGEIPKSPNCMGGGK